MRRAARVAPWRAALASAALLFLACSSSPEKSAPGATGGGAGAPLSAGGSAGASALGGAAQAGGANSGGGAQGGFSGSGVVTGGAGASPANAGAGQTSSGGSGPSSTGGAPGGAAGSQAGGGSSAGAAATGGSGGVVVATGGSGGAGNGAGASGATFNPPFILGADISGVQESNTTFKDTDGQTKSIFLLLKNHGFNYIRLRTFVDPAAPYGYASKANGCAGLSQSFGDREHVIAYGKQAKAAGLGFLLDFHYSDTWADPGNQIVPQAWRDAASVTELAALLKSYTKDVLSAAVAAGARPDMVQVGNEITPGMLMHVPGANTDCWGNNPAAAKVGGSTSNWNNLAALLSAGIEAVREVDPGIKVMLHVENTDDLAGVKWWVDNARSHKVAFDVLGLSCYTAFQGAPSVWENTFRELAKSYPDLQFAIAEYNPDRTQANRIMKNLPNGRGLGTFFWEPTRSGDWGPSMFTAQGNTMTANAKDFAEYDTLRGELGL